MDIYKFTISTTPQAADNSVIPAKGNFIRYRKCTSGSAFPQIKVKTDRGEIAVLSPNEKVVFENIFTRVEVQNFDAQNTVSGELVMGVGDFDSSQVTGSVTVTGPLDSDAADAKAALGANGLVAVLARLAAFNGATFDRLVALADSGDAVATAAVGALLTINRNTGFNGTTWDRVRADNDGAGAGSLRVVRFSDHITVAAKAFMGGAGVSAGGAATFNHIQLKNPAASGVLVYLDSADVGSSAGLNVKMQRWDTDATTDDGTQPCKDLGGTASTAHLRHVQGAGALQGTSLSSYMMPVNTTQRITFDPPIRIGAGEGLAFADATGNSNLFVNFQWREKAA